MIFDFYKSCSKCCEVKTISRFSKRKNAYYGVRASCKDCDKKCPCHLSPEAKSKNAEKRKQNYIKNREATLQQMAKYRAENKDLIRKAGISWRERNKDELRKSKAEYYRENKERLNEKGRKWHQKNKELAAKRSKDYYQKNKATLLAKNYEAQRIRRRAKAPDTVAASLARSMLRRVMDLCKKKKNGKSFELVGFTPFELRVHIESQFEDGMTWANHGEWQVDHIVPVIDFIRAGVTDPKKINSLINLRPLWKEDNLDRRFKFELLPNNLTALLK